MSLLPHMGTRFAFCKQNTRALHCVNWKKQGRRAQLACLTVTTAAAITPPCNPRLSCPPPPRPLPSSTCFSQAAYASLASYFSPFGYGCSLIASRTSHPAVIRSFGYASLSAFSGLVPSFTSSLAGATEARVSSSNRKRRHRYADSRPHTAGQQGRQPPQFSL